jgi:hypothetical protein
LGGAGVSEPTGIAFDSLGNLWVCNYDLGAVTEYTSGVQNTSVTLTGVPLPWAIAVDGLNNVWVANTVTEHLSIPSKSGYSHLRATKMLAVKSAAGTSLPNKH